jgi:predicted nucleic acid-binding protein
MSDTLPPRIYLDANTFILLVEGEPEKAEIMRSLFDIMRNSPECAVTSELTLAEVLAPPRRGAALPSLRRSYLNLILWGGFIELVAVCRHILIETADLRRVARHKLPDAIHIVSAINTRCTHFLSADSDSKRIPKGMVWLRPDADGLTAVRALLHA